MRDTRSRALVSVVVFVSLQLLVNGCVRQTEPEWDQPVTASRLKGGRLKSIDSKVVWAFTDSKFVLKNNEDNKQPIPTDLVEQLLGPGSSATRIEGRWQLDEQRGLLILSEIERDGKKGAPESRMPIGPAGPIRVNLGGRQYNNQAGGSGGP